MAFMPTNGTIMPPTPYINMFIVNNLETDDVERNLTPLKDRGMSRGITIALNITADKTALSGVAKCITFNIFSCGYVTANIAGIIAKYLATSLAILNVV